MSQVNKKFNFVFWGFIATLIGSIATVATVPEVRCSIGLFSETCSTSQKEVELITQTENGETLAGVKLQVISKGAPESQFTDSNGYAKVRIASKGDVRVILSKSGYPTQDFFINLANDQNTIRIVRLSKSKQPDVVSVPEIPPKASVSSQAEVISWEETASKLTGKIDQDFAYVCQQNGTVHNTWGTDIYTIGSSICSAAIHAGIINAKDGGEVQIRILPGEKFYNGTTRNGITSDRYGSFNGSFTFLDSTGNPISKGQVKLIEWDETASELQGKLDQDFTYECNKNGTVKNVWGTDIYTIGSSICSAAVHAGVINTKDGGKVQIRIRPGEKFYNGTTRNGVTSSRYGNFDGSFKFIK